MSCTQNSDRFNEHVECSLFFIDQQHIIFHMLDRCTRWHTARPIPDTTEDTLKRTINEMWITIHGPPKELSVIRETGRIALEKTSQYLHHDGITLHQRAKGQHACSIERRGALQKNATHRIMNQLQTESLEGVPFESILEEAVLCGNAMLTDGGDVPNKTTYGRQAAGPDDRRQPELETASPKQRLR